MPLVLLSVHLAEHYEEEENDLSTSAATTNPASQPRIRKAASQISNNWFSKLDQTF